MKNILDTIKLLAMAIIVGVAPAVMLARTRIGEYLQGLKQLAKIAIVLPFPFALIGIGFGWPTLTASAGLWCTAFLAFLFIWGSLIGVLLDSILPGKTSKWYSVSAERYIDLARGILLWEALTYWLLSHIPIKNNWLVVPQCALGIVCLIIMAYHWNRDSKWLRPILWWSTIGMVVLYVGSFFFPDMGFKSEWGLSKSYVWTEWSILKALVGIGILAKIIHWLFKKVTNSGPATPQAGGHVQTDDTGGLATFGRIVIGFIVLFTAIHFIKVLFPGVWQDNQRSYGQTVVQPNNQLGQGPFVRITPDTNSWTPLVVGKDMYIHWAIEGPGHILSRFNDSPEQEDWSGQQVVTPTPVGPYTVFFKAKDTNSVSLRVYVTPTR